MELMVLPEGISSGSVPSRLVREAREGAWGLVELPSHSASLPLPLQEPLASPSLHSPTFPGAI